MNAEFVHNPGDRRSYLDALQLVFGRDLSLRELREPRLYLAELTLSFTPAGLVNGNDLEFGLADLALCARNLGYKRTALAVNASLLAFHCEDAGHGGQALPIHVLDAGELLTHEL